MKRKKQEANPHFVIPLLLSAQVIRLRMRIVKARSLSGPIAFLLSVLLLPAFQAGVGQTAAQAWLKYRPLGKPLSVPTRVSTLGQSLLEQTAAIELRRGLLSLSGGAPLESWPQHDSSRHSGGDAQAGPKLVLPSLDSDEFLISARRGDLTREVDVVGGSERAILYGVFTLLRKLAQGTDMGKANLREHAAMPIRWVDEWDNTDGSIERGYAGRSIFFDNGHVRDDLAPVAEYARLLASVGINGCNLNNVNNAAPSSSPKCSKASRVSPTPCAPGESASASPSTSPARRRSAASRPSIPSIPR